MLIAYWSMPRSRNPVINLVRPSLGMAHVAGGMGIALVPQSVSALKAPGVVYLPFNDEPSAYVDLRCMFRRGDPSSVLKEFLASIQTFRQRESASQ
ncbi:MAG: hypothetical protein BGO13_11610 [Burkholderiales bacterium 66-5]|nr:MAG: hypothetical protein BGO13_11610 [Burkholderiales bacterium 66-5]